MWGISTTYEPQHEKTGFLHIQKNDVEQLRGKSKYRKDDQRLCFSYTDSTIPLLPRSEITNL